MEREREGRTVGREGKRETERGDLVRDGESENVREREREK
jgi:hypothetical protein